MENYKVTLLIFGILLLLLGLVGKIKAKEIEVGTSSSIVRTITALVGIALIVLSFNPDIVTGYIGNNNNHKKQVIESLQTEKLKKEEERRKAEKLKEEEKRRKAAQKPKCSAPWKWDSYLQGCIRKLLIPGKNYSVKLDRKIRNVEGRIDFYLNTQRLPGADSQGRATYKNSRGKIQVVVPVMLGNTMVGDMRDIIYSTHEGGICSISNLNETTGWMKTMRVSYSIQLSECGKSIDTCEARIDSSGKRVYIKTKPLNVILSEKC